MAEDANADFAEASAELHLGAKLRKKNFVSASAMAHDRAEGCPWKSGF